MSGLSICRHCGQRIVLVNYAFGPTWVHQPAGAAFQDHSHIECHITVAEPAHAPDTTP